MRFILATMAVFMVSACDIPDTPKERDWMNAQENYVCSPEQFNQVKIQSEFCTKETEFRSGYCFGSAVIALCTPKSAHPPSQQGER